MMMPEDTSNDPPLPPATNELHRSPSQARRPIDIQDRRRRRAQQILPMTEMHGVFKNWEAVIPDSSDFATIYDDESDSAPSASLSAVPKRVRFVSDASGDREKLAPSSPDSDHENCLSRGSPASNSRRFLDGIFLKRKQSCAKENATPGEGELKRKISHGFFKKPSKSKSTPDLATYAQLAKVNANYYVPPASAIEKIRTQPPPRPPRPPRPQTLYYEGENEVLFT